MTVYTGELEEIPGGQYSMLCIDPPWSFVDFSDKGDKSKAAHGQYECMSLDAIKALQIRRLAAKDAFVWLWATNPMLPQAFDVLAAWGARFVTAGHWAKLSSTGKKQAFGTGHVLRCAGEPFLIGAFGKPKVAAKNIRSVILAPINGHSRKPDKAFTEAERMIGGPRIELFSRQPRVGWDTWGDQATMFSEEAA